MQRILNTHTNTVHVRTPSAEEQPKRSACGSLRHVPRSRTRVVTDEDLREYDAVDRCGNCFQDTGGY